MASLNAVLLFSTVVAALFHSYYALFYTNSKEKDYPRFGKRFVHLTSILKSSGKWEPMLKPRDIYWKPATNSAEPDMNFYKWRPVFSALKLPLDVVRDSVTLSVRDDTKKRLVQVLRQPLYGDVPDQMSRERRQKFVSLEKAYITKNN